MQEYGKLSLDDQGFVNLSNFGVEFEQILEKLDDRVSGMKIYTPLITDKLDQYWKEDNDNTRQHHGQHGKS